jgi:hypothetical protein
MLINYFKKYSSILTAFLMIALLSPVSAKENSPMFGGGMGVLLQYSSVPTDNGTLSGPAWGIGGRLHFYLGDHFRIGAMGSTWNLGYDSPGQKGSYYDFGYGGLTLEYGWRFYSCRLSLGGTFGGGAITNLHIIAAGSNEAINAIYDRHSTMVYSPMLTFEYSLTKQMALMVMAEYLIGNRLSSNQTFGYPALRIGFLFNR